MVCCSSCVLFLMFETDSLAECSALPKTFRGGLFNYLLGIILLLLLLYYLLYIILYIINRVHLVHWKQTFHLLIDWWFALVGSNVENNNVG